MSFVRQKVVFDTQLVSDAARGKIASEEWSRILRQVSTNCRPAISLNTLYELLVGIAGGDEAHFEQQRDRIRILCQSHGTIFLPAAGDFLRKHIFHLPLRKVQFHPRKLRMWTDVVLEAKDKKELQSGLVQLNRPRHKNKTYGLDLGLILRQINQGKHAHCKALEGLRKGELVRSTPYTWAAAVLRSLDINVTAANVDRLTEALDAAYQYDIFLWDLAEKQQYNFAKHDSDWIDFQQLFYLADSTVLFVPADGRFRRRTKASTQLDQIVTFDELRRTVSA